MQGVSNSCKRILIVDDNTTLAYFTARNLERDIKTLPCQIAASCADAREQIEEDSFSVMITDLNLSDGMDLTSSERSIPLSGNVRYN